MGDGLQKLGCGLTGIGCAVPALVVLGCLLWGILSTLFK